MSGYRRPTCRPFVATNRSRVVVLLWFFSSMTMCHSRHERLLNFRIIFWLVHIRWGAGGSRREGGRGRRKKGGRLRKGGGRHTHIRKTDAYIYYKLIYEPKGSVELKGERDPLYQISYNLPYHLGKFDVSPLILISLIPLPLAAMDKPSRDIWAPLNHPRITYGITVTTLYPISYNLPYHLG